MPFKNPFRKTDYKRIPLEDSKELSGDEKVEHYITNIIPNANKDIFVKYKSTLQAHSLDENSLSKYTTFVAEQIKHPQHFNKQDIEAYFKKQQTYISNFISTITKMYDLHQELKKSKDKNAQLVVEKNLNELKDLLTYCTYNFSKAKKEINKNIGFIDNGPTLTQDGLIFYKV